VPSAGRGGVRRPLCDVFPMAAPITLLQVGEQARGGLSRRRRQCAGCAISSKRQAALPGVTRGVPREDLHAPHGDIDVFRIEFDPVADPPRAMSRGGAYCRCRRRGPEQARQAASSRGLRPRSGQTGLTVGCIASASLRPRPKLGKNQDRTISWCGFALAKPSMTLLQ